MKVNKYFTFAFIYFFINTAFLPLGLTYTALLAPFFYWWVIKTRQTEIMLPFIAILTPFFIVHATMGADLKSYLVSFVNLASVYVFCQAFYTFLKTCGSLESIFDKLLIITFLLCIIAIPFYFTPYYEIFWIKQHLTYKVEDFKRLKLFTYEASHLATMIVPLFFFYFLQIMLKQNRYNSWMLLLLLIVPYILTFSLGVISAILIGFMGLLVLYPARLLKRQRVLNFIAFSLTAVAVSLILAAVIFPDNALFVRIDNIFSGRDSSGNGRTTDAFYLASRLIDLKSHYWGIGLGQLKILGTDIIRNYYNYPSDYNIITIPNASAETLAVFGWIGLIIRILIELFCFFNTQVWKNYYRMALFIFIFIYQFTGSYTTNLAEYVIWILAFTNVFDQFNVNPLKQVRDKSLDIPEKR